MENKARALARFLYDNFGPLIVFYGVNHFYGLKPAILASLITTFVEIASKLRKKEPITGIFKFTAALTLIFGAVDLYAKQSFLFKYESSVTNLFTATFFASTLISGKSAIQDFYEKGKDAKPMTVPLVAYFRLLTLVWVAYFIAKAAAYFWVARNFSIEQGLVVRTLLGTGSLYAMLFVSIVGSKRIYPALLKLGVLPQA